MSFESVYEYTKAFEGGYANDQKDKGGETFRGIARAFWPGWEGWPKIDQVKKSLGAKDWQDKRNWPAVDKAVAGDAALAFLVEKFYRLNFYAPLENQGFPERLTGKLFDAAVNCGHKNAARFLQRALNKFGAGLAADGQIGPKTKEAVKKTSESALLKAVCEEQEKHYRQGILKTYPKAEKSFIARARWLPV